MKQLVFVVEDDADICRLIRYQLETAGYAVKVFKDASKVLCAAAAHPPALFVLDIMLPNGDGRDLCRLIRAHPQLRTAHVIFVTARTAEADRLLGFELGADDYIAKPFSPRELIARIRAILRTAATASPSSNVLSYGAVELNLDAMTLHVRGRQVEITTTEFRLMEVLMKSPEHIFPRQRLLEIVWGRDRNVDPHSIDVYVSRLRDKIEGDPGMPRYLKTVRGVGYYFRMPRATATAAASSESETQMS